jgi:uncharacterized protein YjiS (DUF1127 family)
MALLSWLLAVARIEARVRWSFVMSNQFIPGWVLSSREIARAEARYYQSGLRTLISGGLHTLQFWIGRSRQRRQLGELADLNNYLLKDIGLTREEALREAEKPFWR